MGPLPARRVLVAVVVAFLVGSVLGAASVFEGSPAQRALLGAFGEDATLVLRVENVGPNELSSHLVVTKAGANTLFEGGLTTPGDAARERILTGRLSGEFLVSGDFSWARAGRTASGSFTQRFSPADCADGEAIVVTFRVDTTNGISFPDGDDVSCRRM